MHLVVDGSSYNFFYFISVELNPYAAHVYFNRANLYASLRKYKESEDDYTRGKHPTHPLYTCNFTWSAVKQLSCKIARSMVRYLADKAVG